MPVAVPVTAGGLAATGGMAPWIALMGGSLLVAAGGTALLARRRITS